MIGLFLSTSDILTLIMTALNVPILSTRLVSVDTIFIDVRNMNR